MLKKNIFILQRLLLVLDCGLMVVAFNIAFAICRHHNSLFFSHWYAWKLYTEVLLPLALLWLSCLYAFGMYESLRLKRMRQIFYIIAKSQFFGFVLFAGASYVFKIEQFSRYFVVLFFFCTSILLLLEKGLALAFLRYVRSRGLNFRNVLIIGTGPRAQQFIHYLDHHREMGLKIIGLIDEDPLRKGKIIREHRVLGTLEDMGQILRTKVVDYAFFIVPRRSLNKIEPALLQCELIGVNARVAVDLFDLSLCAGKQSTVAGIPMISFEMAPADPVALFAKRLCDIVISAAALALISPLYFAIAVFIKLSSKGPVYFVQDRCGLHGRTFKLYKFRTMVVDAEKKLKELMAYNEMQGPVFKMENDPRITKIGKFLRKYSLDELPQLWNVFHGDMSLVGPRPPLPSEVRKYDPWHQRRLSIRPGITCIWQASGRNRITNFDQWVAMDLEYIDNWSLLLDFKILFKTIPAVFSGSGAK